MASLSYSHTLAAGTPENVNDVQDMFEDVRTLVNGNLDADNLATSAKPATLLGAWRTQSLVYSSAESSAGAGAASGLHFLDDASTIKPSPVSLGATGSICFFYLDAAELAVSGLTAKLRVRATTLVGSTNPNLTQTYGLYPVTSSGSTLVLGTVVSGSTCALAVTSANAITAGVSTEFSVPSTGAYAFGVVQSAGVAASGLVKISALLQVRHV